MPTLQEILALFQGAPAAAPRPLADQMGAQAIPQMESIAAGNAMMPPGPYSPGMGAAAVKSPEALIPALVAAGVAPPAGGTPSVPMPQARPTGVDQPNPWAGAPQQANPWMGAPKGQGAQKPMAQSGVKAPPTPQSAPGGTPAAPRPTSAIQGGALQALLQQM